MATVSLVITGQTLGTLEATLEITDQDAARVVAYARSAHPVKVDGVVNSAASMQEVARIAMFDMMQKVVAREKKVARATAEAAITDINATPVEE